MVEVNPNRK